MATLLYINFIFLCVCVCARVPPLAVFSKWVASVDFLTVLWILFSLWRFCRSKGLRFELSKGYELTKRGIFY